MNVLATYPKHRGKGYEAELLSLGERLAVDSRMDVLSIIVSDANAGARRLYEKCYFERARKPMVKESWKNPGENWVLLVKNV